MDKSTEGGKAAPIPVSAKFSAAMARWVSACMAKRDIRYYLNGISIDPVDGGGVLITATDGHCLMSAFDKDGTANQKFIFSFSREAIAACTKSQYGLVVRNAKSAGVLITVEGGRLTVLNQIGAEVFLQPGNCIIDGVFPDWMKEGSAPRPPHRSELAPAGEAALNISYLAQFCKELPGDGTVNSPSVSLWRNKSLKVSPELATVFLEFRDLPLLGAIMPRRTEQAKSVYFDFTKPA